MPIYAYRCSDCGHAQDVLQKISDPLLTVCPACGKASYTKQLTAAGFQLKGSGWYVTDFRDGNKGPAAPKPGDAPADKAAEPAAGKPAEKAGEKAAAGSAEKPAAAPAAPAAAPPPAASST
jgi:putative FmdB family regulatory protein